MKKSPNDIILQNYALLDGAFKNLEDAIVTDNYNEVLTKLEPYRKEKENRNRFLQISNNLKEVNPAELSLTKTVDTEGFDPSSYAFTGLDNTAAWKSFTEAYQKKNPTYNGTDPIDTEEFKKYLQEFPQHQEELRTAGILKTVPQKVNKSEDEILTEYYMKAGMTPEDIKFYQDYKKNYVPAVQQNERLSGFVTKYTPYLSSSGSLGDSRVKLLGSEAGNLAFTDPAADEFDFKVVDGNLVRINKRTGVPEIIQIKKDKKSKLNDYSASDFGKLTYDQILTNFSTDDIFKHIDDFPQEIRDKLYELYPQWKPEEGSTTSKTGRGTRGRVKRSSLGSGDLGDDLNGDSPDLTTGDAGDIRTRKAVEKNKKRLQNNKGDTFTADEINQQRNEIDDALRRFKEEYDTMVKSGSKVEGKGFQTWKNNVIKYYNDLIANNYSNFVIEEVEAFVEKHYGFDIKKVRK